MADAEEERVLEEQLLFQLEEQRDSLSAVTDALSDDPNNLELLSVHVELGQAIKDAEEALFQLKRARLLREADSALQSSAFPDDVKVEPLDPTDVKVEPLLDESYSIGSKCRFRHTDGRWYNGLIVGFEGSESAKISFLTPTSESMLMCKFFQQQRCRFSSNCRLSHGIEIPLSSLKKYIPTMWEQSLLGSTIWALSDYETGVWREAELESYDEKIKMGEVVFRDDGSSVKLGTESMTLFQYANASAEEESDTTSELSNSSSDNEDDSSQGLGFLESTNLQKGVQTETAIFTKWENHTRGIASKIMANMGYRDGMGLGASGQGILDPISVKVLPSKQSLDHAIRTPESGEINYRSEDSNRKKRSRGGKRKRDKKIAAAIKAAEEEEESKDVFSLINTQLAAHGQKFNKVSAKEQLNNANGEAKREDRKAMLAYEDDIKNLKGQVKRLEEMANRNKKEKAVFDAAMRKLSETRNALADAEDAHASTSNAVARKEKEKKWLKF